MQYKAKAKTPGRCCLRACSSPGNKIYVDNFYKYLACSEEHAVKVAEIIAEIPEKIRKKVVG